MPDYRFDWGLIADFAGPLFAGYVRLVQVALLGYAVAMALGIGLAVLRLSPSPLFAGPARLYIEILRGIPLFLFLFLVYYGLPQVTPVVLGPFTAAVLALGLTGAAYAAEIYRGALKGVDGGQWEAADAMGLSSGQRMRHVILPQATRIAIPPAMNLLVALLKGATFISVIGVADMFYVSRDISLRFFAPFEAYTFSGLVIIATTLALASAGIVLERRLSREKADDHGTPESPAGRPAASGLRT